MRWSIVATMAILGPGSLAWGADAEPVDELAVEPSSAAAAGPGQRPPAGWTYQVSGEGEWLFGADFADVDGDIEAVTLGASFSARQPFGPRPLTWAASLTVESHRYDFEPLDEPGREDDLVSVSAGAGLFYRFAEQWSWVTVADVGYAGDGDAEFADAFTISAINAVTWSPTRDLRLSFGVLVATEIHDDIRVWPIASLEWTIDERRQLSVLGGGERDIRFRYRAGEQWDVSGLIGLRSAAFALDHADDDELAAFDDLAVYAGVEGRWYHDRERNGASGISATLGVVAYREVTLRTAREKEVFSERTDPSPYLGISGIWAW